MPAAGAGAWSPVTGQWSPGVSAATCEPRPGPATASPEPQHFHITALLQQPPAHNLSHLHIKPNITGTLSTRSGLSGAKRLWCASDSCSLQILVFVTLPGPIQKKIFESEPSSQEEVKLFMVEDKNFMAPIMINYCLILNQDSKSESGESQYESVSHPIFRKIGPLSLSRRVDKKG